MKELNRSWTRREFFKKTGAWAGAGLLQPVLSLIGEGKSIAAAYPEEVLSIEKYTKGRVKPGMVISKDNAELVKDLCPEGLYVELTRGREIKIAETTVRPESYVPKYWIEATLKNKGLAVLDKKGQLWTKDGKPWMIGGDPFPEAKTGLEAMYNHVFNYNRADDQMSPYRYYDLDNEGKLLRQTGGWFVKIAAVTRSIHAPKPYNPSYPEEVYRQIIIFTEPFDTYGLSILTTLYYDQTKLPGTDAYIPTLRRVRRLPSTQRFEPPTPYANYYISDIDMHNDPLLTWSYKLIERKPMLYPSPIHLGAFGKGVTKEDFVFPYVVTKFPRMTWELRPEVLVVECYPHIAGAPYTRKRLYVDAISNRSACYDIWDLAGKLWKWSVFAHSDIAYPDGSGADRSKYFPGVTFVDLQKDYRTHVWILPEFAGEKFGLNKGLRMEDWCTPSSMLRIGRR